MGSLPVNPLMRRLAAVDGLQTQYSLLEDAMLVKQRALELELKAQSKDLIKRRQSIVSGESEPTEEEVEGCDFEIFAGNDGEPTQDFDAKGIPGFWKGALIGYDLNIDNKPVLNIQDLEVLDALQEIRVEKWDMVEEEFSNDG